MKVCHIQNDRRVSLGLMTSLVTIVTGTLVSGCLGPLKASGGNKAASSADGTACKTYALTERGNDTALGSRNFGLLAGVYYNGTGGVKQLIDARCGGATCHSGTVAPNLTTGNGIRGSITAVMDRVSRAANANGVMPTAMSGRALLSTAERALLTTWQADGFPLDAPAGQPTPTPTPGKDPGTGSTPPAGGNGPTFLGEINSFLDSKCMSCHTGQAPKDLNTFEYAQQNVDTIIATLHGDSAPLMPPSGKLEDGIKLFEDWKAGGMPKGDAKTEKDDGTAAADDGVCSLEGLAADMQSKFLEMQSPDVLKKCNEKKQIYNRGTKKCLEGTELLDAKSCNLSWAKARIGSYDDAEQKKFEEQIADGYVVEQCGTIDGDAIFILVKFDLANMKVVSSKGYRMPDTK